MQPAPDQRVPQVMRLIGQGRFEDAARLCAQLLHDHPGHPQGRFASALIDRQTGHLARALATLDDLAEQLPQNPAIRAERASTQVMAGQPERAMPVLEELAAKMPDQPFAHYWIGQAHLRSFRGAQAVACFERVRQLSPSDHNVLQPLAAAHLAMGRARVAEEVLRELLTTHPDHVEGLNSLTAALEQQNRLAEAGEVFRRVLELAPDNGRATAGLARVLQTEGRRDEAVELLREAFGRDNPPPVVISTFAAVCSSPEDRRACIQAAREALTKQHYAAQDRSALCFAAARLLDAEGDYDEAFALYAQGNALSPKLYRPSEKRLYTDHIIKTFSAASIKTMPRARASSDRPVFILGMPRSGTTLVEQMLAAHPAVHAAGEVQELRLIWRDLVHKLGRGSVTGLSRLSQADVDGAARRYLDHIKAQSGDARRITDKMPHNFEQLGLINLLFPQARVIHCARSPLDTCVSCHTIQLGMAHAYSNDLSHLGHAYAEYRRLMEHWRGALDVPMMDVVYEEVVADIEAMARRIVEFAGLPWDDACLRFYEARRAITTASVDQVRKPIYNSSVGRWRRYEKHLGPLRDALAAWGVRLSEADQRAAEPGP